MELELHEVSLPPEGSAVLTSNCTEPAAQNTWRLTAASAVGTSHVERGTPCEDAYAAKVVSTPAGVDVLVCIVSDGAGSASHGGEGSESLCAFLNREVESLLLSGGRVQDLTKSQFVSWLDRYGVETDDKAEPLGLRRRDFASTLLLAIVGPNEAVFVQVGDGAVVVGLSATIGSYEVPRWPERGTYANTTFFVTDLDVSEHLHVEHFNRRVNELALFSDGLETLALHYESTSVHGPFFAGLFPLVRASKIVNMLDLDLSVALNTFLSSERVNLRTDDDKTLVLATRLSAPITTS